MDDERLYEQMHRARPKFAFPPDYQREIWGRVEAAELAPRTRMGAQILDWLARPLPALALLLITGLLGCLLAALPKRRGGSKPQEMSAVEMRYVRSVSPFAAAKLDDPE